MSRKECCSELVSIEFYIDASIGLGDYIKKRKERLVNHGVIMKESEKTDKYLDLARELKKLWNIKMTVILIIFGALVTVSKGLGK